MDEGFFLRSIYKQTLGLLRFVVNAKISQPPKEALYKDLLYFDMDSWKVSRF